MDASNSDFLSMAGAIGDRRAAFYPAGSIGGIMKHLLALAIVLLIAPLTFAQDAQLVFMIALDTHINSDNEWDVGAWHCSVGIVAETEAKGRSLVDTLNGALLFSEAGCPPFAYSHISVQDKPAAWHADSSEIRADAKRSTCIYYMRQGLEGDEYWQAIFDEECRE